MIRLLKLLEPGRFVEFTALFEAEIDVPRLVVTFPGDTSNWRANNYSTWRRWNRARHLFVQRGAIRHSCWKPTHEI
jgi:hypothetical protein